MVLFCFFFFFFFFTSSFFSFIIVILNYCKVDYKVFIIRNNKLIYLSRIKSCLWRWSCYHYSLAQRPISHRIHMFLAALSIICKCGILGIGCVSVWCTGGCGFLRGDNSLYCVWYRCAAPIFQVIHTSIDHNFILNIHL